MSSHNEIIESFTQGIRLSSKSLDLILILFALNFLQMELTTLPSFPFKAILNLCLLLMICGYISALPLFIKEKANKQNLNYQKVLNQSTENAKRLILPFILFIPVILFLLIFLALILKGSSVNLFNFFLPSVKNVSVFVVTVDFIFSLLSVTMLYASFPFSLKKLNFFASLKIGLTTLIQNRNFSLALALLTCLSYVINELIFDTYSGNRLIGFGLNAILLIINNAAAYYYLYRNRST